MSVNMTFVIARFLPKQSHTSEDCYLSFIMQDCFVGQEPNPAMTEELF